MITLVQECRARLQRSRDDRERGMTLTELLIASVVLMIVLTASSSLYISATKSMSMAGATNTNTANASNGMNELARVIRAGTSNPVVGLPLDDPAFLEAKPESVILYSYVSLDPAVPKPVMTHFYLNSQRQLVEDRWPATGPLNGYWSFPSPFPGTAKYTPPQSSRILTTTVPPRAGTGADLFTYYSDVQGKTTPLAAVGAAVPANSLSAIVAVKITLTVQQSLTNNSSPVTLENLVGIPNLNALENIS
jgi:type II secretory pathway pseudopilin PulG